MSLPAATVSPNDRLSFTLLGAISLHALVILGVGFDYLHTTNSTSSTIEVVLVNTKTEKAPDQAEVIANNNQTASGSSDQQARPKTQSIRGQSYQPQTSAQTVQKTQPESTQNAPANAVVHTSLDQPVAQTQNIPDPVIQNASDQTNISQQSDEIAQLVSELANEEQRYAKRPRINHIDTLSAKSAVEAEYIKDWVKKVELIGNINYPTAARQQGLSGQLIMSVLIDASGRIVETDIRHSSGHNLLDSTAQKIVVLAQPFREFPAAMREEYDQLMITRTWLFKSNNTLVTQ